MITWVIFANNEWIVNIFYAEGGITFASCTKPTARELRGFKRECKRQARAYYN